MTRSSEGSAGTGRNERALQRCARSLRRLPTAPDTPVANLNLSMLRGLGVAEDTLGNADKPLF